MNSKSMSEATTYCSEAEAMQQFDVQFNELNKLCRLSNIRRSQRLQEKSDRIRPSSQKTYNGNAESCTVPAISPDVFQSSMEPESEALPPAQDKALETDKTIKKTEKIEAGTVNRKRKVNELPFTHNNATCEKSTAKKPRSIRKVQRQKKEISAAPQNAKGTELKKRTKVQNKSNSKTTERAFQDILNAKQKSEQSTYAVVPPIDRYYIHPNEQKIMKPSVLPREYPPHFVHQLPPLSSTTNLSKNKDCRHAKHECVYNDMDETCKKIEKKLKDLCPTPDTTESLCQEVNTIASNDNSSRTPSIPDSVCEALGTKNLRDLLNIAPIRYRLTDEHLIAAAIILNIEEERMQSVIDLVMSLPQGQMISIASTISKSTSDNAAEAADLLDKNSACSAQYIENSQENTAGASRHFTSQRFN